MIPRVAYFYWDALGPPMSLLRRECIESFRRLNPDWEVRMLDGVGLPISGTGSVAIANRSDLARYEALAEYGGFYFDTDTAFVRPVPAEWLGADLAFQTYRDGRACAISGLGARPGSPVMRDLALMARSAAKAIAVPSYQALGMRLVSVYERAAQGLDSIRAIASGLAERLCEITERALLPVLYVEAEACWSDLPPPPYEDVVGIQWYGGDAVSRDRESLVVEEDIAAGRAMIFRALRASRPEPGAPNVDLAVWIRDNTGGLASIVDMGAGLFDKLKYAEAVPLKFGIEVHGAYIEAASAEILRSGLRAVKGNFLSYGAVLPPLPAPSCAMFVDALEHVEKDEGRDVLTRAQADFARILVQTPKGLHVQEHDAWSLGGERWQKHRCGWEPEELEALGFAVTVDPTFHNVDPEFRKGQNAANPATILARWDAA